MKLTNQFIKNFLTILIIILTLQVPSRADDIKDFQIEGISLGDNALDFIIDETKIVKKFLDH